MLERIIYLQFNKILNSMHLNSNDIFSQIGLVVSNQESSVQNDHFYTVYLQIELSQGKDELLEIRNYDDPHQVAVSFCRKHKLNELAVKIVENKIIQAKEKQQRRIRQAMQSKSKESNNSFNRNSISSRYRNNNSQYLKDSLNKNKYLSKQSQKRSLKNSLNSQSKSNKKSLIKDDNNTQKREKNSHSKNKSVNDLNKSSYLKEKSKSKNKQEKKQPSPKKQKPKKANPNIGNELYARAMMRYKNLENQRQKRRQQQYKKESQQLTFQPKINQVSSKIVQFRKQYGEQSEKQKEKQNKKIALNQQKKFQQDSQIKECTFKPQINRVSQMISHNRNVFKDQFDHFTALYKQAGLKKEKLNAKIDQSSQNLFQPKINPKSIEAIKQTFQERLERSIIRKKVQKEGNLPEQQYPFQPKIGRPPKNSKRINKSESTVSWWNQLYSQKLRNTQAPSAHQVQQTYNPVISSNSNYYFQNLLQKRTSQVFKTLDSDQDGLISPNNIAIQRLTKNQLIFLKPLFQQMDELDAYLDFTEFRKALNMLLSEADLHSKGQFLSQKPKKEERASFAPEINKKSKQLAMTRVIPGVQVFDQLYENGLKELQRKQYNNQRIRQQQEQLQMEECSFKPLLNNTSKYYIDKVLGKKISKFDENQDEN